MSVLFPIGVTLGLMLTVISWYLGSTETQKLTKYVRKRMESFNTSINLEKSLYSKLKHIYTEKKQLLDIKLDFKFFILANILLTILAFVFSWRIFTFDLNVSPGVYDLQHNWVALLLITGTAIIFPWMILHALEHAVKKTISKQTMAVFQLITNNYIVRNNLEAATWDSIAQMPFPIRGIFVRVQKQVHNGRTFSLAMLDIARITNDQAFRDFYNVIISAKVYGGNTETLLYRMIERIRHNKNIAREIKEELNPLVSKGITFTIVMIGVYLAVQVMWVDSLTLVKQSWIGPYYEDSIIAATLLEAGLLLKYFTLED